MGPGYGFSVIAANSTVPARSACNLRMTRSRITGGWWGVIAMGFDWETASPLVASVQIGDETAGNSFEALTLPGNIGGALLVWSGVTNSSFRYNTVIDSAGGVVIDQRNEDGMGKNSFVINDNTFLRLSVTGVFLWSPTPVVEELNDNSFVDISGDHSGGAQPTAWAIAANGFSGVSDFPVIKKARRNQFIGNDVAIVLGDGTGVSFGSSGPLDFGRPDDPGGNVFRCNSKTSGAGGDLLVYVSGTGMAPFAGNVWDHFPPTTGPDPTAPNGTDIITYSSPPSIDTTNGTVGTEACPAGRVKGP
jgi:hypothetical protein